MDKRLQRLGVVLVVLGLAFFAAGGFTFIKTQDGNASRRSARRRT